MKKRVLRAVVVVVVVVRRSGLLRLHGGNPVEHRGGEAFMLDMRCSQRIEGDRTGVADCVSTGIEAQQLVVSGLQLSIHNAAGQGGQKGG